jgi:sugar lactone lactonase YvrE
VIGMRACAIAGILLIASGAPPSKPARHKEPGDGGRATRAEIDGPVAIAVDGSRALYIGQMSCQRLGKPGVIRRVDLKTGTISSVFTQEPLKLIGALALDPSGDLIVADMGRVRRVSLRDGAVRDVADAGLGVPRGVAIDRAGNVYIADNHRVRRVDASTGIITTVAGNGHAGWSGDGGPATQASLEFPSAVAVGADGDLFISQGGYGPSSGYIRRVDGRTGVIETIAGRGAIRLTGPDVPAGEVKLESPHGLVLDRDGNPLFVESSDNLVCRIDLRTGILHTIAGTVTGSGGDGGLATRAKLNEAPSIALDSDGNLFIAEFVGNRVRRVDARTSVITTVAGNGDPHCVYMLACVESDQFAARNAAASRLDSPESSSIGTWPTPGRSASRWNRSAYDPGTDRSSAPHRIRVGTLIVRTLALEWAHRFGACSSNRVSMAPSGPLSTRAYLPESPPSISNPIPGCDTQSCFPAAS